MTTIYLDNEFELKFNQNKRMRETEKEKSNDIVYQRGKNTITFMKKSLVNIAMDLRQKRMINHHSK